MGGEAGLDGVLLGEAQEQREFQSHPGGVLHYLPVQDLPVVQPFQDVVRDVELMLQGCLVLVHFGIRP